MTRFSGKTAIITGAGGGIGRATALLLAREGAGLVLADVKDAVADTAAMVRGLGGRAEALVTDCATDAGVAAIVQRAVDGFGGCCLDATDCS